MWKDLIVLVFKHHIQRPAEMVGFSSDWLNRGEDLVQSVTAEELKLQYTSEYVWCKLCMGDKTEMTGLPVPSGTFWRIQVTAAT